VNARPARLGASALALALAAALAPRAAGVGSPGGPERQPRVLVLRIDGVITGGTAEYVEAGIERAKAEDFAAVCAAPEQPSLFPRSLDAARPILTLSTAPLEEEPDPTSS